MATVDDKKIIFSMVGVSKIIPQNRKQILKDIYLSFFYGAKIGIIGLNGAGKSTLMKIIAGLEQPTQGEVVWSPGYSVGYPTGEPLEPCMAGMLYITRLPSGCWVTVPLVNWALMPLVVWARVTPRL